MSYTLYLFMGFVLLILELGIFWYAAYITRQEARISLRAHSRRILLLVILLVLVTICIILMFSLEYISLEMRAMQENKNASPQFASVELEKKSYIKENLSSTNEKFSNSLIKAAA